MGLNLLNLIGFHGESFNGANRDKTYRFYLFKLSSLFQINRLVMILNKSLPAAEPIQ